MCVFSFLSVFRSSFFVTLKIIIILRGEKKDSCVYVCVSAPSRASLLPPLCDPAVVALCLFGLIMRLCHLLRAC